MIIGRMQLPACLLLTIFFPFTAVVTAAAASEHGYPGRNVDLLKRLPEPPKLSKRIPALRKRMYTRCENGYEKCPGLSWCCQAGLACFTDGSCGDSDEVTCYSGETKCGSGTGTGCCPRKSSCVDEKCVVDSGDVVKRFPATDIGVGLGMSAAAAAVMGLM